MPRILRPSARTNASTMLHLSLLPSLLLPALAPNVPVDELGRAIPDDAPIVIRASDLFALMTGDDVKIRLEHAGDCPTWVLPDEGGDGYYRSELDLKALTRPKVWKQLTLAERRLVVGDAGAMIARGDLDYAPLLAWLTENIYRHGRAFSPEELLLRTSGAPLTTAPYLAYLRAKFDDLYPPEG